LVVAWEQQCPAIHHKEEYDEAAPSAGELRPEDQSASWQAGAQNPTNPQMIEVQWQDCRLFMFAVDVQERGEKVMGATSIER
jgi:hypothetical protein